MSCFTVVLDPTVEAFYRRIAAQAGLTLETVLSDTLFKPWPESLRWRQPAASAHNSQKSTGFLLETGKSAIVFCRKLCYTLSKTHPIKTIRKDIRYLP